MQSEKPAVPVGTWIQSYTGRRVDAIELTADQVVVPDVAHALAQQCRFTGHTCRFYSVGEHSLYVADTYALHKAAAWRTSGNAPVTLPPSALLGASAAAALADRVRRGLRLPGVLAVGAVLRAADRLGTEAAGCIARQVLGAAVHDATEAYLADLATPTKRRLYSYRAAEKRAELATLAALVPGWTDSEQGAEPVLRAGLGMDPAEYLAAVKSADVAVLLREKAYLLVCDLPDWSPALPRDFWWDLAAQTAVSPLLGVLSHAERAWHRVSLHREDPHAPEAIERGFTAAFHFLAAVAGGCSIHTAHYAYLMAVRVPL